MLSDGAATYTPGLSERRGTTSSFYHADALGSTRGITGSTQAATDSTLYDGFGMTVSKTGTNPTPFGFVGASQYQSDTDSGLQLLGHRYYDPSIGRFLSQDPIQDGTNWYAYCDNNPLTGIDPEGLFRIIITIGKGGIGIGKIIADPGDKKDEKGGKYKGDEQIGPSFPVSNIPKHPGADPNKKGGFGPFPPGSYPIIGIKHAPHFGAGAVDVGDPKSVPQKRGTWLHGYPEDQGRTWKTGTKGCERTLNDVIRDIIKLLKRNPKGNKMITTTVKDPITPPSTGGRH